MRRLMSMRLYSCPEDVIKTSIQDRCCIAIMSGFGHKWRVYHHPWESMIVRMKPREIFLISPLSVMHTLTLLIVTPPLSERSAIVEFRCIARLEEHRLKLTLHLLETPVFTEDVSWVNRSWDMMERKDICCDSGADSMIR